MISICFFFFQAEDGIRDKLVTGVQTCALPIWSAEAIESLRPGEQECGFVRERWVPINRLTRRCRSTSGAHRLPLSTRSALRRSRLSARIVRTLWDLSEQSFALSLNIAEVSRIPECSRFDLIRDNLKKSEDRVLTRVEQMREHCVVFPTPNGGCHTLWVLGHLAYIEALLPRGVRPPTFIVPNGWPATNDKLAGIGTVGTESRCCAVRL